MKFDLKNEFPVGKYVHSSGKIIENFFFWKIFAFIIFLFGR